MDKHNMVQSSRRNSIWQSEKIKYQYMTTTWMNLANVMQVEKPVLKDHILYDCIYVECPAEANPYRQGLG